MRHGRLTASCCGLLLAASLAGCGGQWASPSTDLTLLAVNPYVGLAAFHLTCEPSGGDLAHPARACAALASDPKLVRQPKPFTCAGGTFSWWEITISGYLRGRPIRTNVSTCWTPQMAMIGRLGIGWQSLRAHLLPRRRQAVILGLPQRFPGGVLRPGDLVTCQILGHKLEDGIPIEYGTSSTSYGAKNVTSVTLSVTRNRDGSITAHCHRGNP